jgi:hypothetical protein
MIGQVSPIAFKNIGRLPQYALTSPADRSGWRYYLVFTVCAMTNAITFWLLFPETKNRTLEEMDALFRTHPWIVPGSHVEPPQRGEREHDLAESRSRASRLRLPIANLSEADDHLDKPLDRHVEGV